LGKCLIILVGFEMPASHLRRTEHPAVTRVLNAEATGKKTRTLGTSSIALISLAAVLTLRSLPSIAEDGWSSIAYYLLGAVLFFIPLALIAAELATGWPRAGGLYAWVKQAFGDRLAFLAIWFEWVENVVWFPTVLAFVAAAVAYVIEPRLANEKVYLVIVMLTIFWSLTLLNFFGETWILRVNNPAVIIGTLIPAAVLIALGAYWLFAGRHLQIPFSASKLKPNLSGVSHLVFFVGVVLGYAGIEMAGFHAKETRDPKRDFPRAIFLAAVLIVGVSILATLAIAFIVPQADLSLVAGIPQAFSFFFQALGVGGWATKLMSGLVAVGTLALISTWLMGPSKGLYASERTGDLPPELHYVNKRHVPVAMMYILIFAAAIRLRYTQPDTPRAYKIPGGKAGIWIVGGTGIFGSAFSLIIGFVPPSGVSHFPTPIYISVMLGLIVIASAPPFIMEKIKKPGWKIEHPDTVLLDLDDGAAATLPAPTGLAGAVATSNLSSR
jgi:amino acid transporter